MEERLEVLETKLMATEDLVEELNRTVWRQQQDIDLLREHIRQLAQHLKAQSQQPSAPWRPEDEVPPHW